MGGAALRLTFAPALTQLHKGCAGSRLCSGGHQSSPAPAKGQAQPPCKGSGAGVLAQCCAELLVGQGFPERPLCPGLNPSSLSDWPVLLAEMDYAKSLSLRLAAPVSK